MNKKLFIILGFVLLFVGIGAIPSGLAFITTPDGSNLGMPLEALEKTPFDSYLIPGIILMVVNGFGSLLAGIFCLRRHRLSGYAGMFFGGALMIWIIVQVVMIGLTFWLQPAFLVIGIAEFVLGLLINRRAKN